MPRRAAWAGQFYPAEPRSLAREIDELLDDWPREGDLPWALLVPHAGYVYSGRTAAAAYARVRDRNLRRVILIGPSHHRAVRDFALSREEGWETPLGLVRLDRDAADSLLATGPPFTRDEAAMDVEHSLEVQLPFLQRCLPDVPVLPILMGHAGAAERQAARKGLRAVAKPGDLWLVSTDLSHFHDRREAARLDGEAERLIASGDPREFEAALTGGRIEACGAGPVLLLLEEADALAASVEILDRSDSADASGDESSVVGYLAAALRGGS